MPSLTLLIGPAGSGKTERVLEQLTAHAAAAPWPSAEHPPLLLIVPEQQAAMLERALLLRLQREHGLCATARIRVMSLSRLAAWLQDAAGVAPRPLSAIGRRLLVTTLLPAGPERDARAAVLAETLAGALQYGAGPAELTARAEELEARGQTPVAGKLRELAQLVERYQAACAARGLGFQPPAACIPELLTERCWPWLAQTAVWVDGFAGFTPPEEQALGALLARCAQVTATLLLEPGERGAVDERRPYDWYAPARELYNRWLLLAHGAGAVVQECLVAEGNRRAQAPELAVLAAQFTLAPAPQLAAEAPQEAAVTILECASERAEVEQAARWISRLVRPAELGGQGWRYRDLAVITRALTPYAGIIPPVFAAHGIPYFLDQRQSIAHHPAVELLRCGLRLALGQAAEEDVYTLLKTDLLPGCAAMRDRADRVEQYARECGVPPYAWLSATPWRWQRRLERRERETADGTTARADSLGEVEQLDAWRRELLAPVAALAQDCTALQAAERTVLAVLGLAWRWLITPEVAAELARWDAPAAVVEPGATGGTAVHAAVLGQLAALIDELVLVAGDTVLPPQELCAWLEAGLAELTAAHPPPQLDAVLVTDIERGRQQELQGAVLLGLAEDQWPPHAGEQAWLSDAERRQINQGGTLLAGGAAERAAREPYLAMVAATQARQRLLLTYPAGDADGRKRQRSPFLDIFCAWLQRTPQAAPETGVPYTAQDVFIGAALEPQPAGLAAVAAGLAASAPQFAQALWWSRSLAAQRGSLPLLPDELRQAAGLSGGELRLSVSRMERFAACPFQHYARYYLELEEPAERGLGPLELGGFFHSLFEHVLAAVAGTAWDDLTLDELQTAGECALDALGGQLAEDTGRQRAAYVIERSGLLLRQHLSALHARVRATGLTPTAFELSFGYGGDGLPALHVALPAGELVLRGYIDRVDLAADGRACVVDYKLSAHGLDWARMLAGAELQLPAYALAIAGARLSPGALELKPVQAEYQGIEPAWRDGTADFEPRPLAPAAKREEQQAALAELLPLALGETRRVLAELGARMQAGEIAPWPLRQSRGLDYRACTGCAYRALCRFDPLAGGRYRDTLDETGAALRDAIAAGECFPGSAGGGAP